MNLQTDFETSDDRSGVESPSEALFDYFDEAISLGKAAERLGISRFDLIERFKRLRIPLRLGPVSLDEARAEVTAARQARAAAR